MVVVFSDCDCRGVLWDISGTLGFPINVVVNGVGFGTIPIVYSMPVTDTPECTAAMCAPTATLTLSDGTPLPAFMTYTPGTLTVKPTLLIEVGTYELLFR